MHEPYLAVYLQDEALHLSKKLPEEDRSRNILKIDICDIVADDFDEAAKKLGGTMLGILSLWHKDKFLAWGEASGNADQSANDTFQMAMYLISRLSKGCSEDRLLLVDELLGEAALHNGDAKKFVEESWQTLRFRMLNLGQAR